MKDTLDVLQPVALVIDLPERGLYRGQVGAIVEELAPEVYEVEFTDTEGRTYAQLPLKAEQIMTLRYAPIQVAA